MLCVACLRTGMPCVAHDVQRLISRLFSGSDSWSGLVDKGEFCEPSGFIYYCHGVSFDGVADRFMECLESIVGLKMFELNFGNVVCSQNNVGSSLQTYPGVSWIWRETLKPMELSYELNCCYC